jgi:hypothetical protein
MTVNPALGPCQAPGKPFQQVRVAGQRSGSDLMSATQKSGIGMTDTGAMESSYDD